MTDLKSGRTTERNAGGAREAPLSILLVEDEGIVAEDVRESLHNLGYRVTGMASEGVEAISLAVKLKPDLILMDVGLRGEMDGIHAARVIQERVQVPVVFLTGFSDADTVRRAVAADPMGYLVKPFKEPELRGAIEVAVHKHRAEVALREREEALKRNAEMLHSLSLVDELTGIKNRRGFFTIAEQELKVARRDHLAVALFFIDVNGLKQINDEFGHTVGDQALRDAAHVLTQTFRDSDVVARLGGDEFVALARVASEDIVEPLRARLQDHLAEFNATTERPYLLEMSMGAAIIDMDGSDDIAEHLARADAAMYQEKRARVPRKRSNGSGS